VTRGANDRQVIRTVGRRNGEGILWFAINRTGS
jgi:hypothetical protein